MTGINLGNFTVGVTPQLDHAALKREMEQAERQGLKLRVEADAGSLRPLDTSLKGIKDSLKELEQQSVKTNREQATAARTLGAQYTAAAQQARAAAAQEKAASQQRIQALREQAATAQLTARLAGQSDRERQQAAQATIRALDNEQRAMRNLWQAGKFSSKEIVEGQERIQREALEAARAVDKQSDAYRRLTQVAAAAQRTSDAAQNRVTPGGFAHGVRTGIGAAGLVGTGIPGIGSMGIVADSYMRAKAAAMDYQGATNKAAVATGLMTAAGSGLAVGVGALATGFVALGHTGLEQTKIMDRAMNTFTANGVKDLEGLKDRIGDLKDSLGTIGQSYSNAEFATATANIVKAGEDADSAMRLLAASTNLAAAESLDLNDASMLLLKNLNGYKMTTEQAGMLADQLAAAGDLAIGSTTDISVGMNSVASTAYQAGLSTEQLLGMLVELDNAGLSAADRGAEGLRSALSSLADITDEGRKALAAWGIETEDSSGKARRAGDILIDLAANASRLGIKYNEATGELEGSGEALRAVASIMDTQAAASVLNLGGKWKDFAEQVKDSTGKAQSDAETMTRGVESSMTRLNKAWEDAGAAFAKTFAGPMADFLDKVLTPTLEGLGEFFEYFKGNDQEIRARLQITPADNGTTAFLKLVAGGVQFWSDASEAASALGGIRNGIIVNGASNAWAALNGGGPTAPATGQVGGAILNGGSSNTLSGAGPLLPGQRRNTDLGVGLGSSDTIQRMDPSFRNAMTALLAQYMATHTGGLIPYVHEGYRSNERQAALYAQGRTRPGAIVTNANAGQSIHNYGLAADIYWKDPRTGRTVSFNDQRALTAARQLGQLATQNGLLWGGNFQGLYDAPHIQANISWQQARAGVRPSYRIGGYAVPSGGAAPANNSAGSIRPAGTTRTPAQRAQALWDQLQQAEASRDAEFIRLVNNKIDQFKNEGYGSYWDATKTANKGSGRSGDKPDKRNFEAVLAEARRIQGEVDRYSPTGSAPNPVKWQAANRELERFKNSGALAVEALRWIGQEAKDSNKKVSEFGQTYDRLSTQLDITKNLGRLGESPATVQKQLQGIVTEARGAADAELKRNGRTEKYLHLLDLAADAQTELNRVVKAGEKDSKNVPLTPAQWEKHGAKALEMVTKLHELEKTGTSAQILAQRGLIEDYKGQSDVHAKVLDYAEEVYNRQHSGKPKTPKDAGLTVDQWEKLGSKAMQFVRDINKARDEGDTNGLIAAERQLNLFRQQSDMHENVARFAEQEVTRLDKESKDLATTRLDLARAMEDGRSEAARAAAQRILDSYQLEMKGAGDNAVAKLAVQNKYKDGVLEALNTIDRADAELERNRLKRERNKELNKPGLSTADKQAIWGHYQTKLDDVDTDLGIRLQENAQEVADATRTLTDARDRLAEQTTLSLSGHTAEQAQGLADKAQANLDRFLANQEQLLRVAGENEAERLRILEEGAEEEKRLRRAVLDAQLVAGKRANDQQRDQALAALDKNLPQADRDRLTKAINDAWTTENTRLYTTWSDGITAATRLVTNKVEDAGKARTEALKRESKAVRDTVEGYEDLARGAQKKIDAGEWDADATRDYARALRGLDEAAEEAGISQNELVVGAREGAAELARIIDLGEGRETTVAQQRSDNVSTLLGAAAAEIETAGQLAKQGNLLEAVMGLESLAALLEEGPQTPATAKALSQVYDELERLKGSMTDGEWKGLMNTIAAIRAGVTLDEVEALPMTKQSATSDWGRPQEYSRVSTPARGQQGIDAENADALAQYKLDREKAKWTDERTDALKKMTAAELAQRRAELERIGDSRALLELQMIDTLETERATNQTELLASAKAELDGLNKVSIPTWEALADKLDEQAQLGGENAEKLREQAKALREAGGAAERLSLIGEFLGGLEQFGDAVEQLGTGPFVKLGAQMAQTFMQGQAAWERMQKAMNSKNPLEMLGAAGGMLSVVSSGINLIGQFGQAVMDLSPAFQEWKTQMLEVAQTQKTALGLSTGGFISPWQKQLEQDAANREKLANAGFWQRVGWGLFGGAPQVMKTESAKLLAELQTIFAELGSGIANIFSSSMESAFLEGDITRWAENFDKTFDEMVGKLIIKTMVEAAIQQGAVANDLAALTKAIQEQRYGDIPGILTSIKSNARLALQPIADVAPSLPGYGSGNTDEQGNPMRGDLFGNAPSVQLGIPRIEVQLPQVMLQGMTDFAASVPEFRDGIREFRETVGEFRAALRGKDSPPPMSRNGGLTW